MQKTSQFTTQCKGDISHAYKTAKTTVTQLHDPIMCKSPDVPLQAGMLALTIQMRTSQPSKFNTCSVASMGILIHLQQMINTAARLVRAYLDF